MAKTPARKNIDDNQNAQCKPEDRFCGSNVSAGNDKLSKEYSKETEVSKNPKTTKEDSYERAGKEGYATPSQREGAKIDTSKKTGPKLKTPNDNMPENVNDRMGNSSTSKTFKNTDLGDDLPNRYREESADIDPNQMSRSEEEELENNTDLRNAYTNRKKQNPFSNNRMSDSLSLNDESAE